MTLWNVTHNHPGATTNSDRVINGPLVAHVVIHELRLAQDHVGYSTCTHDDNRPLEEPQRVDTSVRHRQLGGHAVKRDQETRGAFVGVSYGLKLVLIFVQVGIRTLAYHHSLRVSTGHHGRVAIKAGLLH